MSSTWRTTSACNEQSAVGVPEEYTNTTRLRSLYERKTTHRKKLIDGSKGLSQLKVELDVVNIDQIRCQGCIVEWIEPRPRWATLVIVSTQNVENKKTKTQWAAV